MNIDVRSNTAENLESAHDGKKEVGYNLCTSESYDFLNISFDGDRGEGLTDATVAVIDCCREMDISCNRDELTFMDDLSGLEDYKELSELCEGCCTKMSEKPPLGISAHGFFCAAIIASRKFPSSELGELKLDTDVCTAIEHAVAKKVDVISISLGRYLPGNLCNEEELIDYNIRDRATLDAFNKDIVTVVPAGNYGPRLRSVGKAAPWCLTVASCTSRRKFRTKVEFGSEVDYAFDDLEGESISMFSTNWKVLRMYERIVDFPSIMYSNEGECIIQACSDIYNSVSATPFVCFSKDQSNTIFRYLDVVAEGKGKLYVKFTPSTKVEIMDPPLVSEFSSRGPCSFYKELMKPDISAPGEHIAAAWPQNVPLGGFGRIHHDQYNICSGTSFAVPHVAAGVAKLRAEKKFSAPAIISAIITTAVKMHGKDPAGEYAYGAGLMDINRAMQPGCVFEETGYNHEQCFCGNLSHYNLNLPYFSATFSDGNGPWDCLFRRRMSSVENGRSRYNANCIVVDTTLDLDVESIQLTASPSTLEFEDAGDEKEFTLSVHIPHTRASQTSSGASKFGKVSASLIWVNEMNDKIRVDCPIILSSNSNHSV